MKKYIRMDDADDVQPLIDAAEGYLSNAGVAVNESDPVYKLAVKLLASHWNDTRTPVLVGTVSKEVEYSLRGIIQQLQLSGGGTSAGG